MDMFRIAALCGDTEAIIMQTQVATPPQPLSATSSLALPERRRFVTINECAIIRPFSAQALRDMKFKAFDRTNSRGEIIAGNGTGPAGVWVQIGTKVLVDLDALDRWIESRKVTRADD
jgi:hypothetical protein